MMKKYLPEAGIHPEAGRTFPWPPSYHWKRAEEELGYRPLFDIGKGVRDFIDGFRKSRPRG